tara:strand:- start:567 stop:977 length:411 start_codon:yes stop_codon:yes gene_type:complete
MNVIDRLKSLNARDLAIVVVGTGAIAGLSGVLTIIDRELFSYTMGFKPRLSRKASAKRGALIGGIFAVPLLLTKQSGPSALGFPNQVKYNMNNDQERIKDYAKSRFSNLPPAPKDYIYTTDDVGRQLLILDPATGF